MPCVNMTLEFLCSDMQKMCYHRYVLTLKNVVKAVKYILGTGTFCIGFCK